MNAGTYIRTHIHTHIHTHTLIHIHVYTYTHIHTHTHIHTYINTHQNTHKNTNTYQREQKLPLFGLNGPLFYMIWEEGWVRNGIIKNKKNIEK